LANQPHAANARADALLSTSQSLWISGAIIVGGGTLLSMIGPVLVRRYVTLERLTINNEMAVSSSRRLACYTPCCLLLSSSSYGKS
jgi:hypothetical protein